MLLHHLTRLVALSTGLCIAGSALCYSPITVLDDPQPYTPFRIEVSVSGVFPPVDYVFVDVVDNVIFVGHKTLGIVGIPPGTPPFEIEIQGLPPGSYTFGVVAMPFSPDGELRIQNFDSELVIPDVPVTTPAFTFFNDRIQHYFITAGVAEAQGIAFPEEQGWFIVDPGFNVWPAEGPAPEAALPVCRFYSFDVNSHFYTADEAECLSLRTSQSSWVFEGIAFRALVPTAGVCPAGLDPVWRLYNDRAAELDTNHRFVASGETYRTMIADGWIGEGVAFCSPPTSD